MTRRVRRGDAPPRVLLVNHTATIGGAEHSLLELLAHAHPDRDVSYTLAAPAGALTHVAATRAPQMPSVPLPELTLSFSPRPRALMLGLRSAGRSARALRRAVAHASPDVIHANSIRAGLLAVLAVGRNGPPVVFHARDELPTSIAGTAVRRLLRYRTAGVVAISEWIASTYRDFPRVTVIDNPVDTTRFSLRNTTSGPARDGAVRLGVVAQITPWKRQHEAIEALHVLRQRGVKADLTLVGSVKFAGPATRLDNAGYAKSLHDRVRALGLEAQVTFAGERNDVPDVLAAMDVLLSTSEREPFGRTVAEALCSGVPVVCTDDGGPAELVEVGLTGATYRVGDVAGLADAVVRVVHDSSPASEHQGLNGFERARARFEARRHVEAVAAFYRAVLGAAP